MNDDNKVTLILGIALLILLLALPILGTVNFDAGAQSVKTDAVKRGFAKYNENTGEWGWKEK